MIIECINCKKKFQIDSNLIPDKGRNIQCGSCKHIWFYKKLNEQTPTNELKKIKPQIFEKKIKEKSNQIKTNNTEELKKNENYSKQKDLNKLEKNKESIFGSILSYLIVLIISFFAIIILLDTFKTPIGNYFPEIEFILFSLFETFKDILSFLKNLFKY